MGATESNSVKVSFYTKTIEDADAAALVEEGAGRWTFMAIKFCDAQWSRVLYIHV
jgi:hypothetical protein